MRNSELLKKIEALRVEFKTANEVRKEEIKTEASKLKSQLRRCAQCSDILPDDLVSGFCSDKCRDLYWPPEAAPKVRPTLQDLRKKVDRIKAQAALNKRLGKI